MTNPIRIGIIGTSWWADLFHLPLFSSDPRVKIAFICGRNQARTQEMASKFGGRLFVDSILSGQSVAPSFYEGWQTQRVIDAAIVSHQQGKWVEV